MRAAALRQAGLTDFILEPALREAKAVNDESECVVLSERDSLIMLNLLEKEACAECQAAGSNRGNA